MSLNPINDILSGTYESDVPKLHTSGRRESRVTQTKGYYIPRPDGKPGTAPIRRSQPKRPEGMGARQYRIWKKKQRNSEV